MLDTTYILWGQVLEIANAPKNVLKPVSPTPKNPLRLDRNLEWPNTNLVLQYRSCFQLPGKAPVSRKWTTADLKPCFLMPGCGAYSVQFDMSDAQPNAHGGASYIKYIADMLVANNREVSFTPLTSDWTSCTYDPAKPQVAYLVYSDELVDTPLLTLLHSCKVPLLAVITDSPCRDWHAAGISYTYDEEAKVYTGRSAGRGDYFTFKPSPFAKYNYYCDRLWEMRTVAQFAGQRLVYFSPNYAAKPDEVMY